MFDGTGLARAAKVVDFLKVSGSLSGEYIDSAYVTKYLSGATAELVATFDAGASAKLVISATIQFGETKPEVKTGRSADAGAVDDGPGLVGDRRPGDHDGPHELRLDPVARGADYGRAEPQVHRYRHPRDRRSGQGDGPDGPARRQPGSEGRVGRADHQGDGVSQRARRDEDAHQRRRHPPATVVSWWRSDRLWGRIPYWGGAEFGAFRDIRRSPPGVG